MLVRAAGRRRRGDGVKPLCTEGWTLPDRATRGHPSARAESDKDSAAAEADTTRARDAQPADTPKLDREEELLVVLRGVGAVMFLTNRRVIVARDGMERRPRSGIQSFRLDALAQLRLELGSSKSGRIAVWTKAGAEAVSMFFDAKSHDRAVELVEAARRLVGR